jgi:magnesium-transporting ATPase (P-type)
MTDWYNLAWNDVVNLMQSNSKRGLLEEEVLINREKYGVNKIVGIERKTLIKSMLKQLVQPWIICILINTIVYFILHIYFPAVIYMAFLLISICTVLMEKYTEQKDLKTLQKFNAGDCSVIRNGRLVTIKNEDLVVGDIVVYKKENIIPADLRIMDCEDLSVKEDAVTGDDNTIEKYSAKLLEYDLNLSEMRNILFKSSVVKHGSGEGIVVAVGMNTEIGKIMERLVDIEKQDNVFLKGIQQIANIMALIGLAGSIIIILNQLLNHKNIFNLYEYVSVLLSTSLPYAITAILIVINLITKLKFKREGIFFKDISKIQMAASIDVLITEKEGAFTQKNSNVRSVYDTNTVQTSKDKFIINDNMERILETAVLCNDYNGDNNTDNTIEVALRRFSDEVSNNIDLYERHKRILKMPYDKEKRIQTTVNKVDRNYRAYVKGAVDVLLEECTHIMKNGIEKEITAEDIEEIKAADIDMSNECLYVIGTAYRNFNYRPSVNENIESNLVFAGLIGINNPIKDEMDKYIKNSRLMAVKPVLCTEDSKLTAMATGKKLGLLNVGDVVMSGIEMDYMEEGELERNIEKISMFSRILSAHKIKIVNAYKDINYNIALTANKLTDLPALKIANLSISHGEKCSSTLKKLSDIYLRNFDFKNLIESVYDSKSIINSMIYIFEFLFVSSLSQVMFCIFSVMFYDKVYLSPIEIIWLNIFNTFILSMGIFSVRKTLNNNIDEKKVVNKDIWNRKWKHIVLNSTILALLCCIIPNLSVSSSMYSNGMAIFIIFSVSQIVFMTKFRFIKNIIFDFLMIFYVLANCLIITTRIGQNFIELKFVNLFDAISALVIILVFILISIIKYVFTKKDYIIS